MEVLEAYCTTMLDGCKTASSGTKTSSSGTHSNHGRNEQTFGNAAKDHSTQRSPLETKPVAAQLQDIKKTLWPKSDFDAPIALQSSKPHIASRKYNRKKRIKENKLFHS